MAPLTDMEKEAEISLSMSSGATRSLDSAQKKGSTILNLNCVDAQTGLMGKSLLEFQSNKGDVLPPHKFGTHDVVVLKPNKSDLGSPPLGQGVVYRIKDSSITVAFDDIPEEGLNSPLRLEKLANEVTYRRMKDTLIQLSKGVKGPASDLVPVLFGERPPTVSKKDIKFTLVNSNLDHSQMLSQRLYHPRTSFCCMDLLELGRLLLWLKLSCKKSSVDKKFLLVKCFTIGKCFRCAAAVHQFSPPAHSCQFFERDKTTHKESSSNESCSSAAIVGGIDDLLREILVWLPSKSVIKFKTVSKQWLSLISSEFFTRLHIQNHGCRFVETQHSFIVGDGSSPFFLCHPTIKRLLQISLPHPIKDYIKLLHSTSGLLLLSLKSPLKDIVDCVVFNPTTRQYRFIHVDGYHPLGVCLLFDPSKSEHYKLFMKISVTPPRFSVYDSATRQWRHDLIIGDALEFNDSCPLTHNLSVCSLMLYDTSHSSLGYLLNAPESNLYMSHLVESNGHMNILQLAFLSEENKHCFRVGVIIKGQWVISREITLDFGSNTIKLLGMIREERVDDSVFLFHVPGRILTFRFSDDGKVDLEVLIDYRSDYFYKDDQLQFLYAHPFIHTFAPV